MPPTPTRFLTTFLLTTCVLCTTSWGQDKPAASPAPPTAPAAGSALNAVVEKEVRNLSAEDFPERQAALARLQALVAEQLKQRAQIQDVLDAFASDLAKEQHALALVADEEAQAQIGGLLEMERGLAGWTVQTMSEPLERRKALLNWGLTKEVAPVLARAYAHSKRARMEGVRQLAKLTDAGADWTMARLINDPETVVRAAAMAACWNRAPNADIVGALWFRAVAGPLALGENEAREGWGHRSFEGPGGAGMIRLDFPGGGEPLMFDAEDEGNSFFDSQLAGDVLVHMNSPLVGQRVKALVEERIKAGKSLSLSIDPDWTLVTHRLVETYGVKEAVPLLAAEALGTETDEMGGDMNGRPFMWSRRTMAIGTLCKLIGKDAADFDVIRARDMGDPRGWMWAVDVNPAQMNGNSQADGAAVRAFYAFWKDHHAEYGVKEEPSSAGVPPVRQPGRGRGWPMPVEPGPAGPLILPGRPVPEDMPLRVDPANVPAPDAMPPAGPDAPVSSPPMPRGVRGGAAG